MLVPFDSSGVARLAALGWVRARFSASFPAWELVVAGADGDGEWSKGAAVATAVRSASGDILVVSDGDVWSDGIGEAVRQVEEGRVWAMPHGPVRRLDESGTVRVLAGEAPGWDMGLERAMYEGVRGGGLVVLTRAAYRAAPIDPRFHGWGAEDFSFGDALRATAGPPWRGSEVLWHLHHPPANRFGRYLTNEDSRLLAERYRATRHRAVLMAPLLDEARAALAELGLNLDEPAVNPAEGESNVGERR